MRPRVGMLSKRSSLIVRRAINTTRATKSTLPLNDAIHSSPAAATQVKKTYLDTLSNKMLFCYGAIGFCTLNKFILNTVIKAFPLIPTPVLDFFIGKIYCGGANAKQVIDTGKELSSRGINNMMLSLTIEDSEGTKNIDINYIVEEGVKQVDEILKPHFENLALTKDINSIPPGYIVIKPSALVSDPANTLLNYEKPEYAHKWAELNENCETITRRVEELNNELKARYPERVASFVITCIDAEKFSLQKGVYELQRNLFKKFNHLDKPVQVVGTLQMYLVSALEQLKLEERLSQGQYKIGWKLVRGAYVHSEPDRTVIHPTKEATDSCYNQGISYVMNKLAHKESTFGHLVVATHNEGSAQFTASFLKSHPLPELKSNVMIGQLLGMSDELSFKLLEQGNENLVKYVPWGPPLETRDYLLRRLQENGDAVRSDNGWRLVKDVWRVTKSRLGFA